MKRVQRQPELSPATLNTGTEIIFRRLRSGHPVPIHDRERGRRDRTEGGIATDRHVSVYLRTIESAKIPPDHMTGPRWAGVAQALEER
jgi:hypothetical protein